MNEAHAINAIRDSHPVGPSLAAMTDADVLELFNEMLEAQAEIAAGVDPTLTEIPPGLPQIEYNEGSDQWVPRGQVLRCHIEGDGEEGTIIQIDGMELDMAAFGRMLQVFSGFGMRIAFVDEEDVTEEPEIVVREPDDDSSFRGKDQQEETWIRTGFLQVFSQNVAGAWDVLSDQKLAHS